MKKLVVVFTLVVLGIPSICAAIPARPGPYVSGFVGISIARDASVASTDFVNNATFDDRVEFDPGISIGGTGGYDFGFLRLEGELSYKHAEIKSITDKADGFQFGNVDGNLGALGVMFNAFIDLHNQSPITPYVGGGIGFAELHLSDTFGTDTRGGTFQRTLLYPSDDATVFAYQAGAGLEIAINRGLSLDVGYRYFGTDKAKFNSDVFTSTELKYESHNAVVGVRFKF